MLHIVIADDESLARQRLSRLIDQLEHCELIGEASNGREALAMIDQLDPDLVLLDVRMPGLDGLEVARQLSELHEPPAIIFCTAYDEYAIEAFSTLALGYIVKPVQFENLRTIIDKAARINKVQKQTNLAARSQTSTNIEASVVAGGTSQTSFQDETQTSSKGGDKVVRKHISARTHHGIELIPLDKIYCFIADQKYVTVYYEGGEMLIDDTLKDLHCEFANFYERVHRNALVRISEIEALERIEGSQFQLRLKSSSYRPVVSRRHIPALKKLLNTL